MNETEEDVLTQLPNDKFVFVPLGGATGIGMNFFLYGFQGKYLLVDCGVGFPGDGLPGVDVLLPDASFLADKKKDIVGLVVTHGHEDHIGAVGYLWRELQCPIYATPFTAELIESKLNEVGLLGRADITVVEQGSQIDLKPFEVEFINMSHSIPEANALAIKTSVGTVVHTGDWKPDSDPILQQEMDRTRLKELGKEGVLALVCDSTNVFGEKSDETELDVQNSLVDLIAQYKGKQVAVACFASNVSRVQSIYKAGVANGREVCLMGKSLWRIDAAARATGYFEDIPDFLSEQEALTRPVGSVLYICTGSQGEPYSALSSLSAMTPQKNSVYFGPDDVVIFSSRIIPGNEKAIELLQKRFKAKGVEIVTNRDALVHVSGHYVGDELKEMYRLTKPKIALPVHGEARELNEHAELAQQWGVEHTFALEDGEVLTLEDKPQILGLVHAGILAVDGKKILPLGAEVIRKRRKMIEDGTLVITAVLDKAGHVLGDLQLSSFGLLEAGGEDEKTLKDKIRASISALSDDVRQQDVSVETAIRTAIRQFLKEFYGKKPLIEVHLVRI